LTATGVDAGRVVPPAAARRRPALRFVLVTLAALAGLAMLVAVVTAAIVLSGSTEVGLVRDRVAAALSARLGPDLAVSVGRAAMRVDPALGLVLELERVEARDAAGAVVLSLPETRLALDVLSLLGLSLVVTRAEIAEPAVALVQDAGGRIRLAGTGSRASDPAGAAGPPPSLPQLADAVAAADAAIGAFLPEAGIGQLEVVVSNGDVALRDAVSGNVRRFRHVALSARADAGAGEIEAKLAATGWSGPWSGSFSRRIEAASGDHVLSAGVAEITLADIAPSLAASSAAEIPLFASLDVVVDARGMRDATLRLDAGAGVLDFGTPDEAVLLDEATLRARWDGAAGEIVVEPSSVHFGPTSGSFTGVIRDEGSGRMIFAFDSSDTALAARDSDAPPLAVQQLEIGGTADLATRMLDVDRVVIRTAGGTFAGAVRLAFTGETPSLSAAAELSPMDIATWKRMWPPFIAPGARRWALDNISGGRIASARFDAAVPAGVLFRPEPPTVAPDALRLDLRLEDVTVATFGGLPPITHGSGRAVLAGSTFGVDLDSGELVAPSGGVVRVDDGAFAIDDVFSPRAEGVVEVEASGTAQALGALADAEPFRALARRDLAPADLSGTAEATVSVRVPLSPAAGEDAAWKVAVRGKDLGSARPVDGRLFRHGDLAIEVTPAGVSVNGTAEIDGVVAAVSLAQPLAPDGGNAPGAQQAASLVLDGAARRRLGLDIEDIVSGTIGAEVRSLPDGIGQHYDLDLRAARIVLPGLGWAKEAGVPATMRFDLRPVDGGSRAQNIVLEGKGFGFSGVADIEDGAGLVAADLTGFHLREGDDIAVGIRRDGTSYAVAVEGAAFDLRDVIAELTGADDAADSGSGSVDIALEARVEKLRGHNGRTITDAEVTFALAGGVPRKLTVNGRLAGGPLSLAYADDVARASLRATAGNAGAVLQYLDIYDRIGGGGLAIAGERPSPTGPVAGTISITDFAILDEPAMREVVSRAKPKETETIDAKRMHAEEMSAVFRYTGDQVFIDDAFLRGSAMGATFSGLFDLVRSTMAISGTYIPLFGINNAFSRVPVVGRLLGGKSGEGLIGVTFKVEGPIDGPRVFINPLSAVAPGILRKIFEFR